MVSRYRYLVITEQCIHNVCRRTYLNTLPLVNEQGTLRHVYQGPYTIAMGENMQVMQQLS
jgi:hypothetical protein